ncbi:acylase [Rhodanobacter glycinis]|uniref:Acylase n=1 Tax=Rhodanobacter glycinis TaxID=582702 RepID=A0A5B9DXI1_9GAMM|nr:penicillin acylase family protein [Rhodanobacter glycinis]QEE23385.1 acylase [Rhodanobacter glycinis]
MLHVVKLRVLEVAGIVAASLMLSGFSGGGHYDARVQRIDGGIPYITANDYGSLGYGTGYAMAQDMPCMLAREFLTYAGQRSRYLGDTPGNRASDFFYQLFIDRGSAKNPVDSRQAALFEGAAAGYNRYLADTGVDKLPNPACRSADWVHPIHAIDFRRISHMSFILDYMQGMIVAATPPKSNDPAAAGRFGSRDQALVARHLRSLELAERHTTRPDPDFGSNGIALGRQATANHDGMLLVNPHQPWHGRQRFYAFAQSIPGQFFVVGANEVGRPQVGFGAAQHVAWMSPVSTAQRITFYRLELVPGHPTEYLFDGKPRQMSRTTVHIRVRGKDGKLETVDHTFYTTHYGAYLVGGKFPWTARFAYAVRVPTAGWRGVDALIPEYQSKNVRQFAAVQNKYQFLPVNLVAADADGEVYYADPGPIPDLSDAQRAECKVPGGLDGSRSICMWHTDPRAAVPGILPPTKLPHLFRSDYVANMNDSSWLSNPKQPLTGYGKTLGSTGTERTLRTRSGLYQIARRLAGKDGQKGDRYTLSQLQGLLTNNLSYTGLIIRDDLVTLCDAHPKVEITPKGAKAPVSVDISAACPVLAHWDLHANLDSRGVALFREFMNAGVSTETTDSYRPILPPGWHYRVAFDPAHAVTTPRGLDTKDNPEVLKDLARAVLLLRDAHVPLDAPLGQLQYVTRNDQRIPIPGGTNPDGLLHIIHAPFDRAKGAYPKVTGSSSSWTQVVEFTKSGPKSRGLLTYSESPNPESPHYADQTRLFSAKRWIDLPFNANEVNTAAKTDLHLLSAGAKASVH